MKKSYWFVLMLMLTQLTSFAQSDGENSIKVIMENFKSNEGSVRIALYGSADNWLKKVYKGEVKAIIDKKAVCTFENIPDGVYAVSLFHDENDNEQLDTGYFGIPKEPYACSRGATGTFGPPKWVDAKFTINGSDQEIAIRL